ncbi:UspA domain-containing protein [Salinarchaeum sp. Harcht-Bsk1]|uniref:universal stress protein n=1 Tax=Salinarchaeum sp. Harcht-Bsk1 TaxID=1333523 RepID=UPI0003422D46|nr:universal stress protein [Salinarchaeum sp. Harcht-Bsk1]AGN02128.1 UspA domain-containing protein [Salinarchaeum sp. Harcht-Bsk1]
MYDQFLLPTDGSDGTDRAIDHSLELAGTYDATLHVLSVLDDASLTSVSEEAATEVLADREAAVEAVANAAREAGVDVVTSVREGSPHREILAYADEAAVDVIVMGTHGRSGVGRVLLGSVTERVVRDAPVPVVTVRMDGGRGAGGETEHVTTPAAAERRARAALEDEGHDEVTIPEDPYRTTTAWVVPATADGGTYNVHVDADTGATRIGRLDH